MTLYSKIVTPFDDIQHEKNKVGQTEIDIILLCCMYLVKEKRNSIILF
jgi:hypothetical protein